MSSATMFAAGNSSAVVVPKPFRDRNGLSNGDRLVMSFPTPSRIVIDAPVTDSADRVAALSRAFELASELESSSTDQFPDDEGVERLLGDRDA